MEEISGNELYASVIVLLVAIILTMIIVPPIVSNMENQLIVYKQSLKIDDADDLVYAHRTDVGNVFADGMIEAIHPVSNDELKYEYSSINKITEKYTRHTRQVCNSRDDEGNCKSWRTEVYYTWDYYKTENDSTDKYNFLDIEFDSDKLNYPHLYNSLPMTEEFLADCSNLRWGYIYDRSDIRHYYRVLPVEFYVSIFMRFENGNIIDPFSKSEILKINTISPDEVIQAKENSIKTASWAITIGMILLFIGVWIFIAYAYLDL